MSLTAEANAIVVLAPVSSSHVLRTDGPTLRNPSASSSSSTATRGWSHATLSEVPKSTYGVVASDQSLSVILATILAIVARS